MFRRCNSYTLYHTIRDQQEHLLRTSSAQTFALEVLNSTFCINIFKKTVTCDSIQTLFEEKSGWEFVEKLDPGQKSEIFFIYVKKYIRWTLHVILPIQKPCIRNSAPFYTMGRQTHWISHTQPVIFSDENYKMLLLQIMLAFLSEE